MQEGDCPACSPVETYENILDNYCRADLVIRARVKRQRRNNLLLKKSRRVYKSRGGAEEDRRALRRLRLTLTEEAGCCSIPPSPKPYLIMARRHGTQYIPTFVLPLKKSKPLRQAMKMFKNGLNCSDPNLITNNLEGTALSQEPPQRERPSTGTPRPNGRGNGGRGSGNRAPGSRGSTTRRRCFRKCRKSCQKKCRSESGTTCRTSCGANCRGSCRQARGRGRGSGTRRGHRISNNNRHSPQDIIPLSDITSEITNFAPSDIERPQPEQGAN
ncbi:hypothetical protein Pmani_005363 [Petrolisthes manimaculis]|uniref:NTR domain-containing protein n=1 Tax=Petrolisthes manimaculis TaxID=1843537 RepID=A0AAE1QCA9_9EUCA|nr:hypothetical protein Pmani_005363 [Petrolisthes manimaculis]